MLLSIIIPTKNRYSTLFSVIDMILSFDLNESIELVIQDNSNNNTDALNFIAARANYLNLRYFHCSENLSVIENSDKAVLNSSGEFVCFIGDDDGIMPNIVDVTKWMKENDFKALKSYKPNYYWPNQKSNYLSKDVSGILKYKTWKQSDYKLIATSNALAYTLKRGGVSIKMLPCLYHGIVERRTLDKIYDRTSTFFPGPSPDMANAIALTQVLSSYVTVGYPVIISGKSSKSTGGAGVLHQHISKIEDVKHLPRDTAKKWCRDIPKYWTGPTIWAESVLKALLHFENHKATEQFNFQYLYAYILVFHKIHKEQIFKDFPLKMSGTLKILQYKIFLYRIRVFISNRIGNTKIIGNVPDIKSAVHILKELGT